MDKHKIISFNTYLLTLFLQDNSCISFKIRNYLSCLALKKVRSNVSYMPIYIHHARKCDTSALWNKA